MSMTTGENEWMCPLCGPISGAVQTWPDRIRHMVAHVKAQDKQRATEVSLLDVKCLLADVGITAHPAQVERIRNKMQSHGFVMVAMSHTPEQQTQTP